MGPSNHTIFQHFRFTLLNKISLSKYNNFSAFQLETQLKLSGTPGSRLNIKMSPCHATGAPIIKIRRSWDHLIYTFGILYLKKNGLYIETGPRSLLISLDKSELGRTGACAAWWRHQMETFSALLPICHRSPVNSQHRGQWRGALTFSLICARINRWVNNGEAGDLRR